MKLDYTRIECDTQKTTQRETERERERERVEKNGLHDKHHHRKHRHRRGRRKASPGDPEADRRNSGSRIRLRLRLGAEAHGFTRGLSGFLVRVYSPGGRLRRGAGSGGTLRVSPSPRIGNGAGIFIFSAILGILVRSDGNRLPLPGRNCEPFFEAEKTYTAQQSDGECFAD